MIIKWKLINNRILFLTFQSKSEVSVIEFAALMNRLCKSGHDDRDKVALVFGYSISIQQTGIAAGDWLCFVLVWVWFFCEGIIDTVA